MCPTDATPVTFLANETYADTQGPFWRNSTPGFIRDETIFLQAWLRQPATVGAIMPTRSSLARAMALEVRNHQPVIELGGGTGPITRALVQLGVAPTRLTVVERNPVFHKLLADRFPGFRIVCGDAESLSDILCPAEMGQIGTIVSSLPRVGWSLTRQRSILAQCFAALGPGGVFLEFSYGPVSPVPRCLVKELGLVSCRLRRVWRNFPPATIWRYRRQGERLI